jgi:predicted RNA-binding Zn ribbon-like protein
MQVTTPVRDALELVRSFVNTMDREDGVDVLDRGWLADQGLLARGDDVSPAALRRLSEVREAIRELLLANNGLEVDSTRAAATLDAAALRARVGVRFRSDATVAFEPDATAGDQATGRILGALATVMGTDAWSRLKACRWDACGWAFFDEARNRSRAWCSMASCGNRAKARAYRSRQA